MDKIIPYGKVRIGYEIVHDGKLILVEKVRHAHGSTEVTLNSGIIDRDSFLLTAVRRPVKPRSAPSCPPLTARLSASERAWVESFSGRLGIKPQELIALAVAQYRDDQEAPLVPEPAKRSHFSRWRRKR